MPSRVKEWVFLSCCTIEYVFRTLKAFVIIIHDYNIATYRKVLVLKNVFNKNAVIVFTYYLFY